MLCKSWRALETTERGDIITQELFTFYCRSINLTPFLMIQCDTAPLKIWLPHPAPHGAWDSIPSVQSWTLHALVICCSLFVIVRLPVLLKYLPLWLLSVSSAGVSSFRPLKVKGAPGLKSSLFSWDIHAPWREPWGSSLGKPSHANDCEVYIPALTAPQNPYTWQMKPYLTSLCGKGQNWTLDFKTSPPTVLPISGIASPPTQVLKLKSLSHPWSLPFISLPTPNPSANLSALLSKDLGHTLLSPPRFSPPLEGHSDSSLVSPPLLPKVSPATPHTQLEGRCKHLSQITSLPCSESSLSSISFRLKVRVLPTANQAQHILPHHLSDFILASLPLNSHAGLLCIPLVPIS